MFVFTVGGLVSLGEKFVRGTMFGGTRRRVLRVVSCIGAPRTLHSLRHRLSECFTREISSRVSRL